MSEDPKRTVQAQFGRQASSYATSRVHRHAAGLAEVVRLASPFPQALALDLATGAGFTALAMAPRCRRVIGLDLTFGMVREARRLAGEEGITNLMFCLGDADAVRSEEHTSELQSHSDLVCRLLLEKKKRHRATKPLHPSS